MANKTVEVEEVRVLKRGGGAAATFAFFALVIALVALVLAVRAHNHVNAAVDAANKANANVTTLRAHVNNVLGSQSTNTPAGTDSNTPQPVPNGNDQ